MANKFDKIIGKYRESDVGAVTVTEYDNEDKPSPSAGDVWVKKSHIDDGTTGTPRGLLLTLTYSGAGISTYALRYKNEAGDIIQTTLS